MATDGRFHSNWLDIMYSRLLIARNLLKEDGAIFISIDDHEIHHLHKICDEVFGEDNFVANIVWQKRTSPDARINLGAAHDYILVYAKDIEILKPTLNKIELQDEMLISVIATEFDEDYVPSDPTPIIRQTRTPVEETKVEEEITAPTSKESILPNFFSDINGDN